MRKTTSFFCLIACTFIWGTTFIAQDTGMDNIGPFTFNSVRFFVGFLVVAPFVFLFERLLHEGKGLSPTRNFPPPRIVHYKNPSAEKGSSI